jgi:hypothetical protein
MTNASISIPPVRPCLHTTLGGPRRFNAGLGVLDLVQGIAMLAGMYDIASLLLIVALNAAMILFGWLREPHNQTTARRNWTAAWFGCPAGVVPWIAIAIYLVGAAEAPAFVYAIVVTQFALSMLLQYRRVALWREHLLGERVHRLLSQLAKSALAWPVFAGTLRPV